MKYYSEQTLPEEYARKAKRICRSFKACSNDCPLDHGCPSRLTLDEVEFAYNEMFGNEIKVTENEFMGIFSRGDE